MSAGREQPRPCECGNSCCQTLGYLESILLMLHKDGPENIGKPQWDLVCSLIDELGK